MIMDDPGAAIFEADPEDEYRLTFSVSDPLLRNGRRPLMTMRCFEKDKLHGAIVWVGEHQHLWPEWRAFAEAYDANALSARMVELMEKEALERFGSAQYMFEMCLVATVSPGREPRELELSVSLTTRSVPVIKHAFADTRSRDAFMDWLASGGREIGLVELAELALLRGRLAMAKELDVIARDRLHATDGTVH